MGVLTEGELTPLTFEEIQQYKEFLKTHGIQQFCRHYNKIKDKNYETLKWGDEIEMMMIRLDDEKKTAPLNCKAVEILGPLMEAERQNPGDTDTAWRPEFTEFMIESSPGRPYGGNIDHFNTVEANMKIRRDELMSYFTDDKEQILSLSTYPRIGCQNVFHPPVKCKMENNTATRSYSVPDSVINKSHLRHRNLATQMTKRKGRKIFHNAPIFRDTNTPNPFIDPDVPKDSPEDMEVMKPNHVHLDCVTTGLGCGCLQTTFQACNVEEARTLYDQQTVLAPIVMALSASSPCIKGYLLETDTRWENIAGLCDERTPDELGLEPLKDKTRRRLYKSRYGSVDMYLSEENDKYNDIDVIYRDEHLQILLDEGIDNQLARHIAHLFTRDPLAVYKEMLSDEEMDHFELFNSTNYQSVRFKPPPPATNIGWRVEMRPIESQLTDFENAAFVSFVVLLTRVCLSYELNLAIPMSKVEKNMERASKRNALQEEKFFFRINLGPEETEAECKEMTMNEIINGKDDDFPGLLDIIQFYLDHLDIDADTKCTISQYLKLISARASGELLTTASWMRKFIRSHPKYKFDSVVSEEINYDLMKMCTEITNGKVHCPDLFTADQMSKSCRYVPEKNTKMLEEVEKITKSLTERNTSFFFNSK
ncbi:glutamate--cysteine ligase catalytic subunit-like [Clytia hemisphaerica]|uniref:Glutamate--cysteine ligase n=1 Tax=Clytia hemisphaerica TaxID=252671 RepID=A0A7M5WRN8_9CNID